MIIREITPEDIETITRMRCQMLDEVTEDPLPEGLHDSIRRFIWKHMRDKSCLGVVAEMEGHVVADAVIYIFETMPDEVNVKGLTAMLYSVYTLPPFRGQGIMAQMLPKVIQLAKEAGAVELKMTAEKKAIPLYERMGFHVNDDAMKMRLL